MPNNRTFASEAEKAVLGCILIDNSTMMIAKEFVTPDDFFIEAHRIIYKTFEKLDAEETPIDIATVFSHISDSPAITDLHGIDYLLDCEGSIPSALNVAHYAKLVKADSTRRKLALFADNIKLAASKPLDEKKAEALCNNISNKFSDFQNNSIQSSFRDVSDIINTTLQTLQNENNQDYIKTGFKDLDGYLSGLKPGSLTIIAARPAMGKTALALNIISNIAFRNSTPTAFFSLEMTAEELTLRLFSSICEINGNALRQKILSESDWKKIILLQKRIKDKKTPLYIDETGSIDISVLCERAKTMKKKHDIKLIAVDYIQLIQARGSRMQNREQEVAMISRSLKALSKDLHIPVIALAQLNRQVVGRANNKPLLSDLRESGSIEQDADNIIFIHRDGYYDMSVSQSDAQLIIAKQRSGPTGTIKVLWEAEFTRFKDFSTSFNY